MHSFRGLWFNGLLPSVPSPVRQPSSAETPDRPISPGSRLWHPVAFCWAPSAFSQGTKLTKRPNRTTTMWSDWGDVQLRSHVRVTVPVAYPHISSLWCTSPCAVVGIDSRLCEQQDFVAFSANVRNLTSRENGNHITRFFCICRWSSPTGLLHCWNCRNTSCAGCQGLHLWHFTSEGLHSWHKKNTAVQWYRDLMLSTSHFGSTTLNTNFGSFRNWG